jgi:hypothetical protein
VGKPAEVPSADSKAPAKPLVSAGQAEKKRSADTNPAYANPADVNPADVNNEDPKPVSEATSGNKDKPRKESIGFGIAGGVGGAPGVAGSNGVMRAEGDLSERDLAEQESGQPMRLLLVIRVAPRSVSTAPAADPAANQAPATPAGPAKPDNSK